VRRSSATDVLFLRHADGAVPRSRHHTGPGPHSRQHPARVRATGHRAIGGVVVCRTGGGQLRVALADPQRHVDHDRALAVRALAAFLALTHRASLRHAARDHASDWTVHPFTCPTEPTPYLVVLSM